MPIHAFAAQAARGRLEPFDYEPGPLGPNEVEVSVTHCGICHSDVAMIDNDWHFSAYPLVPGHEVIGTVAAIGSAVKSLCVGQRVGVGWQCGSCHECEYCHTGQEHFCLRERDTIVHHHGGFGDRVRVDAEMAVPIPDGLPSGEAAPLMCAGNTVYTPMRRHGVTGGMRTAVVGIGGLGHLALQFLSKLGCHVTAISSSRDKEAEARDLGADAFIATKGTEELKKAARSFDFVINTVAADLPWGEYLAAMRPRGVFVVVGIPDSEMKLSAPTMVGAEIAVAGGRAGSPWDIRAMLEFAARHQVKAQIETFPMAEANAALDRVRSGKARYRVVLER